MDASELLRLVDSTPWRGEPDGVRWEFVRRHDGMLLILPASPPPFLFRGQTRRYSPCFPSICRGFERITPALNGLAERDRLRLILHMARAWWFCRAVQEHPAMLWASQQTIFVDGMALAQHYGIPTGYMDLTQSPEVALFFATCAYRDDEWHPVAEGKGVFYRVPWKIFGPDRVRAIGLQPFPRPAEQWAWTLETCLGDDFERMPYLQQVIFDHVEAVGRELLGRFHGGTTLFPPDVMARVASSILASNEVPEEICRAVIDDFGQDPQGLKVANADDMLQRMTELLQVRVTNESPQLIDAQEQAELKRIWAPKAADFFKSVGFRLQRTRRESADAESGAAADGGGT